MRVLRAATRLRTPKLFSKRAASRSEDRIAGGKQGYRHTHKRVTVHQVRRSIDRVNDPDPRCVQVGLGTSLTHDGDRRRRGVQRPADRGFGGDVDGGHEFIAWDIADTFRAQVAPRVNPFRDDAHSRVHSLDRHAPKLIELLCHQWPLLT